MDRWGMKFDMKGDKKLFSRLGGLDRKLKRKISAKVIRAGAKVQSKALRAAAPQDTGAAKRAIGTKVKTYRGSGVTVGITGERKTKRSKDGKETKAKFGGPHLHLIEYGTQERFQTGQKAGQRGVDAITKLTSLGYRTSETALQAAQREVATGKARSKVARAVAKGHRVGRATLADLRRGRRTGRVRPKPFFKRTVQATAGAARAAMIDVLKREIPAAARGGA